MSAKTAPLPEDFPEKLTEALWMVRVGAYAKADRVLEPLRPYIPTEPVELSPAPDADEYYRLRLVTLVSEVADYKGDYYAAEVALRPYERIVRELQELPKSKLHFDGPKDPAWLLFRQKLYYLWQKSVLHYRADAIARSKELLNLAIDLAEHLKDPRSQALLIQLYYGAGKVAFHECREVDASRMYRESLMSASDHFIKARKSDDFRKEEFEAARYSVGKTLALGLGQVLREQGRLEEARTQVVAGLVLLNLSEDEGLVNYASLLLGSIERSIAGERRSPLLERARDRIIDCSDSFKDHKGEVGYRSRLELALVAMQENRLDEARESVEKMLKPTPDPKWVAECYLALSRIARRAGSHSEAVEFARKSVKAAEGLERIRRRAQVVLVLALYAAATEGGKVRDDVLKETLREIERAMVSASEPDVRTHANMLLTKARVLKTKGEIASALDTFEKYKAIQPLVEVGRIHELADEVEKELAPATSQFRCPADFDSPIFDLDQNMEALRRYVIQKVTRKFDTKAEQATALGRNRTSLYTDINKPK